MELEFSPLLKYWPQLVNGGLQSIKIVLLSLLLGCPLGMVIAVLSRSGYRFVRIVMRFYVEIFRTTPALLQILWIYLVLPSAVGVDFGPVTAAWVALGLNTAAFLSEILKAGFNSVEKTQYNAALVLRLSRFDSFRFVILPQLIRNIFPPAVALLITTVKYSSLAAGIGALELTRVGQLIAVETFRLVEILSVVAIIYFVIAYPFAILARSMESRLRKGMY